MYAESKGNYVGITHPYTLRGNKQNFSVLGIQVRQKLCLSSTIQMFWSWTELELINQSDRVMQLNRKSSYVEHENDIKAPH